MRHVVSPLNLMLICWTSSGLAALLTFANIDQLELVRTFMAREQLDIAAVTWTGVIWQVLGLAIYALADTMTRLSLPGSGPFLTRLDLNTAARLTFYVNLCFVSVTLGWIISAATQTGGLANLANAVYIDSLSTRDLLLENKLFTGMRLFYAALPATGGFAAGLLACMGLSKRARRMCTLTLGVNAVMLFVLPIVMSQRLLLLQFLLSAYLAACLVRGHPFGLHWIGMGLGLFLGLWMVREVITNPTLSHSALEVASQKLAFYVVNDMWNSLAPLSRNIPHTNGALTFEGLSFLTFTDGYFQNANPSKIPELNAVLGGGEFPFFTTAFVDFGPLMGMALVALFAVIFRLVFQRACGSLGWAVIYGQIGAALLFSSHSVYVTHQNFLFSIVIIAGISRLSRRSGTHREGKSSAMFRSRRGLGTPPKLGSLM